MQTEVLTKQAGTATGTAAANNPDGTGTDVGNGNAERARLRPRFGTDGEGLGEELTRPPRTIVVLAMLAGTALIFSYLGAYAVAGALVRAEVVAPWDAGSDPRPTWLIKGFFGLLGVFVLIAALARFFSWRQLRHIDAMGEAEA